MSVLLKLGVLVLALLAASACRGTRDSIGRDEMASPQGRILYIVNPDPLRYDEGTLIALSLGDGRRQSLVEDVGSVHVAGGMASDGESIVVVKYGPERTGKYGPEVPWLLRVDLATGLATTIGTGTDPAIGPGGVLAYCATDGRSDPRIVVTRLDKPEDVTVVSEPYVNCPPLAWSQDGRLAFFAPAKGANGQERPDPAPSVYVYRPGQQLTELPLSEEVGAGGDLSWSADDAWIAFPSGWSTVLVDPRNGNVRRTRIDVSSKALFSPVEADILAVDDQESYEFVVKVYRSGEVVRTLSGLKPTTWGTQFAWAPDGEWLAVAITQRLFLWNWKTGEVRTVVKVSGWRGLHPALLWIP